MRRIDWPNRVVAFLSLLAALAHLGGAMLSPAAASELRRTAIVKAVQNARPAVVNIHGHKTLPPDQQSADKARRVNGMGTGVVIDKRGYIVTNYHVVEGVTRIQVTLANRKTYTARLVAHDTKTDLAIIRISKDADVSIIKIGTSKDLMPGEPVVAVGNAFGYEHTVTRGIISALHRSVPVSETQHYDNLIQTDASINPGNSGGPLLNIDGDMIGINVAVRVGAQGIGFAIPVDEVMDVAARLLSVERLENQWHGITGKSNHTDRGSQFHVKSVQDSSPGKLAGIESGDRIVSIDKTQVERALDVERALLGRTAGEEVEVVIHRGGVEKKLSIVMARTPTRRVTVGDKAFQALGMRLQSVSSQYFRRSSSRYRGGLEVTEVLPGSAAARQGVRQGDILVGMHVWETVSLENVAYVLSRSDIQQIEPVKCYLLRGGETLYTHLPVGKGAE